MKQSTIVSSRLQQFDLVSALRSSQSSVNSTPPQHVFLCEIPESETEAPAFQYSRSKRRSLPCRRYEACPAPSTRRHWRPAARDACARPARTRWLPGESRGRAPAEQIVDYSLKLVGYRSPSSELKSSSLRGPSTDRHNIEWTRGMYVRRSVDDEPRLARCQRQQSTNILISSDATSERFVVIVYEQQHSVTCQRYLYDEQQVEQIYRVTSSGVFHCAVQYKAPWSDFSRQLL